MNLLKNEKHNALKEYAHKLLQSLGFSESEIKEEYTIKNPEMKEGFRVDVAGIKPDYKVAVECGLTNSDKLGWEKLFFDEVIVLPFFKMDTEGVLLQRRIRELEEELEETKNRLKEEELRFQDLLSNSGELSVMYLLVKSLVSCLEGKSNAQLGLWDYHLGNATESLFRDLMQWKERYEELRKKREETAQKTVT